MRILAGRQFRYSSTLLLLSFLVLVWMRPAVGRNFTNNWVALSRTCDADDPQVTSLSCHGVRIIRKVVQQLILQSAQRASVEIFRGVRLAAVNDYPLGPRAFATSGDVVDFLRTRELRISLPSLLPENVEPALRQTLRDAAEGRGHGDKGGKKGGGGMFAVMLMCKMMATMGFGALGFLAMKALMISALALMLSLIVAAKKLHGDGHDDHAHVVYAQESHHHRKRSVLSHNDLAFSPYRGYADAYVKASNVI